MKMKLIVMVGALLLCTSGAFGQDGILSLESVDGLWNTDTVQVGKDIVFSIRVTNTTGADISGMTNGFRIYSPNEAVWHSVSLDTLGPIGKAMFDLNIFLHTYGSTGSVEDTVGFGAAVLYQPGLPVDFDDVAYSITLGPFYEGDHGKTICLDSSWFPTSGRWKWQQKQGQMWDSDLWQYLRLQSATDLFQNRLRHS